MSQHQITFTPTTILPGSAGRYYTFTSTTCRGAALVTAIGAVLMFGAWLLNIDCCKTAFQNTTAGGVLCLCLAGSALFLLNDFAGDKYKILTAKCSAAVVIVIACTSAFAHISQLNSGLNQFIGPRVSEALGVFPGDMAFQTAISFVLLSAGILCLDAKSERLQKTIQILALIVIFCGVAAVVGDVYGFCIPTTIDFSASTLTSCLLVSAGTALFVARPHCGPASLFTSDTTGGIVGRWVIPFCALLVATCALVHVFRPESELFIYVMLVFFILPTWIWLAASMLDTVSVQKRNAHNDIEQLNHQLNAQVQELLSSYQKSHEALQTRSEFLAKVSHELRTPLGGIISTTEILLGTNLSAEQKELSLITLESGHHLLNLINEILDFSKIDAHQMLIESIDVNLLTIITSAVESLRAKAEQKGLSLISGMGTDVPHVIKSDPGRLRQILINLLDNAIKFTNEGQVILTVGIQCQNDKQQLFFRIKDSGIGIPAQFTDRLFQPFVQADGSMTRRYGGSGLGLSICKTLIELMGGNIGLKSAIGDGSEFWFTIPYQLAATTPARRSVTKDLREITSNIKSNLILIVEDNPVNAKIASLQLCKLGYLTEVATNGADAVRATAVKEYDLILMDVQMPEMDGLEATRLIRLRESLSKSHVPIIALTAHAMPSDREKCILAGMDEYLAKPPALAALSALIKKLIPESHIAGNGHNGNGSRSGEYETIKRCVESSNTNP